MLSLPFGCRLVCVLSSLLVVSGCTHSLTKKRAVIPGAYQSSIEYRTGSFTRSYRAHVPENYDPESSFPLVVVIHGAFDTAKGIEKISGFSNLADEEGFIVMYPNGIGIMGFLQHWNAGHCCGKAAADEINDIDFVEAAIKDLFSYVNIDRQRIYMVGFSNGGMFVHRFAAEKGYLLAAAAPMAASAGGRPMKESPLWEIPEPKEPVPIISFHGRSDEDVPFNGGGSVRKGGGRTYLSVEDSLNIWLRANDCQVKPDVKKVFGGQVELFYWKSKENKAPVVLYLIDGWGHEWPGPHFLKRLQPGHPLYDFDAAALIWDFFKQRSREPAVSGETNGEK